LTLLLVNGRRNLQARKTRLNIKTFISIEYAKENKQTNSPQNNSQQMKSKSRLKQWRN
jgi:hypothetical protein